MAKSLSFDARDNHRQHIFSIHYRCFERLHSEGLDRHFLPPDIHRCVPQMNSLTNNPLITIGFLTIYAKLSDVFGKKTMLLLALLIFTVFSGLCGATNNVVDL
jgi:hypothetical protein